MLESGDLNLSFSGLKTAVLTVVRREASRGALDDARRADIACEFQHAVIDVLVAKALAALGATGHSRLVVAGGVGANRELRTRLAAGVQARGGTLFFPELEFCTDNGAMIALVGALRLELAPSRDLTLFREATLGPGIALGAVMTAAASAPDRAFLALQELPDIRLVPPDEEQRDG